MAPRRAIEADVRGESRLLTRSGRSERLTAFGAGWYSIGCESATAGPVAVDY